MSVRALEADVAASSPRRFRWLPGLLRDLLIAGAIAVGLWMTVIPPALTGRMQQVVLALLCLIAVVLRGWIPVTSTALAVVVTVLAWVLGATADPGVMVGLCLFTVAERYGARVFPWWLWLIAAVVSTLALVMGGTDAQDGLSVAVLAVVIAGSAWALGTRTRQARRESAARARAEERLRLVREVHDVLSHSLGTIGVQAGVAAHVTTLDADRLREILREVEEDARTSLAELRTLLRREREDASSTPGAPLGETIQGMMSSLQRAGIAASVEVEADADRLPVVHQQTIRRIVQEGITNTIRHSGATSCRIVVRRSDGLVEVTVSDDGHGPGGDHREGNGLIGLRERAAMLDGRLELHDGADGFALTVSLPVNGGEER